MSSINELKKHMSMTIRFVLSYLLRHELLIERDGLLL